MKDVLKDKNDDNINEIFLLDDKDLIQHIDFVKEALEKEFGSDQDIKLPDCLSATALFEKMEQQDETTVIKSEKTVVFPKISNLVGYAAVFAVMFLAYHSTGLNNLSSHNLDSSLVSSTNTAADIQVTTAAILDSGDEMPIPRTMDPESEIEPATSIATMEADIDNQLPVDNNGIDIDETAAFFQTIVPLIEQSQPLDISEYDYSKSVATTKKIAVTNNAQQFSYQPNAEDVTIVITDSAHKTLSSVELEPQQLVDLIPFDRGFITVSQLAKNTDYYYAIEQLCVDGQEEKATETVAQPTVAVTVYNTTDMDNIWVEKNFLQEGMYQNHLLSKGEIVVSTVKNIFKDYEGYSRAYQVSPLVAVDSSYLEMLDTNSVYIYPEGNFDSYVILSSLDTTTEFLDLNFSAVLGSQMKSTIRGDVVFILSSQEEISSSKLLDSFKLGDNVVELR